jgi:hypothetical protein
VLPPALVCLLVAGCAPRILKERPADWPETWRGRHLYNTPRAFIYATSAELAGEADRVAVETAGDFEKATRRPASKGLLVVSGPRDEPVITDFKAFFLASARREAMVGQGKAPSEAELEEKWKSVQDGMKDSGFDLKDALTMVAVPLTRGQLLDPLGLPEAVADGAPWAAVLPTDGLIRASLHRAMDAAMARQKLGLAARLLVAPMLLAVEAKMVAMMSVSRNTVLFEQMARGQADWSEEQIDGLSKAYSQGRLKAATAALQAETRTQAARLNQATSRPADPAATRPASRPGSPPAAGPATPPASLPASNPVGDSAGPPTTRPVSGPACPHTAG